jgi:glycosyltransferase involved in cell wall biosynthesis
MPKADLHIHSRYSDRPREWLLRRLDFPDSLSDPRDLHTKLRERGMDYVTLTDHDRIDGCLEIADLPGVFISEQVTAFFPDDRCPIHLLVWGISEAQHTEIQALKENVFELQAYLSRSEIAHAVAHPLHRLDERFSGEHLEKLLLLFKHFEGLNGLRDALLSGVFSFIARNLSPEKIRMLAERHHLEPTHQEPWQKILIGGSDDHGGIYPASAHTETPSAESVQEFLAHIREGRAVPRGAGGSPLALSHSLYNTIYAFLQDKLGNWKTHGLLGKAFSRFMEGRDPTEFSLTDKISFLAQGIATGHLFELAKPANASLWKELAAFFNESDLRSLLAKEIEGVVETERRSFIIANLLANQLAYRFFLRFVQRLSSGRLIESIQEIGMLIPVVLTLSPYLYAFQSETPSRRWLRGLCKTVTGEVPKPLRNEKRAWFTDTLEDVNGVATTIRKMTAAGAAAGKDIMVVTSRTTIHIDDIPLKNFPPIGEFELPEYELQKLSFPPILLMLDYVQREGFSEIIISTPGPVGLTGLIAAKMLKLQTCGIYHTDFPQYVRILTDDSFLETLTWNYMHWFYSQLDIVYVNSEEYRQCWIDRGIAPEKIRILPRGLDLTLFHPCRRNGEFRHRYGIPEDKVLVLYVGRISKEKNLDVLSAAYLKLRAAGLPVHLALVGEGPYLKELRETLPETSFTGCLNGEELAQAYAAADVFGFPSTTDTFGNVVIEALASGLPVVVSNQGGPHELVEHGITGLITRGRDVDDFAAALATLAHDPVMREQMRENGRRSVKHRDWSNSFAQFWAMSSSVV